MKRMLHIALTCMALTLAAGTMTTVAQAQQHIEGVAANAPTVTGEQGRIVFTAGAADAVFCVYSITGQQMRVVRLAAGQHATIELPRGFYVVKCNNQWSRKVVVR